MIDSPPRWLLSLCGSALLIFALADCAQPPSGGERGFEARREASTQADGSPRRPEPRLVREQSAPESPPERRVAVERGREAGASEPSRQEPPRLPEKAPEGPKEQPPVTGCQPLPGPHHFYVDPKGRCGPCSESLARADNTIKSPWCSIKKATELLLPGDTAVIRGGVYTQGISIKKAGAAGKLITYQPYPHEKVEIQSGIPLHIEVDFIKVVGLRLVVSGSYGARIQGAKGVTLLKNEIYSVDKNNSKCIYLNGVQDVVIEQNDLSFTSDGIHTTGKLLNVLIKGNKIIGRPEVFPQGAHPDGFQSRSSPVTKLRILNNIVKYGTSANLFLQAIGAGPWKDVVVAGNVLVQSGDGLAGKQIHFSAIDGFLIECNTMVTQSKSGSGYTHGVSIGGSTSVIVRNNIFHNSIFFRSSGFVSDYNLYYRHPKNGKALIGNFKSLAQFQKSNPGKEVHSVEGEAQFVAPGQLDYRLRPKSPGKDQGTACSSVQVDFFGSKRPQGKGWDIGALE